VRIELSPSSLGPIVTDQDGHTLYAFTRDKNGSSSCAAQCIATWPALTSDKDVTTGPGVDKGLLSATTVTDGPSQVVYHDWPLYYYVGDQGPGDVDGQGVDGEWFVLDAAGKLVKAASG
jgi:predicted lipoprotein with Yx(FWY)xxD motif